MLEMSNAESIYHHYAFVGFNFYVCLLYQLFMKDHKRIIFYQRTHNSYHTVKHGVFYYFHVHVFAKSLFYYCIIGFALFCVNY